MTGSSLRTIHKPSFQKLEILTLPSQYILSLMRFLSPNLEIYKFNSSDHGVNMRYKLKSEKPSAKLTMYQRGVCYSSIKICDKLLNNIAELASNKKYFILQLKKYVIDKAFYSPDEYLKT
jgi:hypothetical protein